MGSLATCVRLVRVTLSTLCALNLMILIFMGWLDRVDESRAIQLVPQSTKLLIVSRTYMGTYHILQAKNWMELERLMQLHSLELPLINDAYIAPNLEARIRGKSIIWGSEQNPKAMGTPDFLSAQKILPYVQFGNLGSSPLGHSILIQRRTKPLILGQSAMGL